MKGLALPLPLPSDFDEKGVLDLDLFLKNKAIFTYVADPVVDSSYFLKKTGFLSSNNSSGEPTSVLDSTISGGRTSSSTPSSSDADPSPISSYAVASESHLLPVPPCLDFGTAASGQSIFRWVMGDVVEEPAMGNMNSAMQIGGSSSQEFEFASRFGIVDHQEDTFCANSLFAEKVELPSAIDDSSDQAQLTPNPSFFSHHHHKQAAFGPPQAKRTNLWPVNGCLGPNLPFTDTHQQQSPHIHLLPHFLLPPQVPNGPGPNPKDDPELIQTITNQLYNVAELIHTGNFVLAQGILARLNHAPSPSSAGGPFNRAAFYCKEALQMLLDANINGDEDARPLSDLIFKIAAYKLFSEISPLVDFANLTCNQALLEASEGLDRIHIVDFDIGFGGQWASLMQELGLRGGARPSLKITALVPHRRSAHHHLELCLVRENLFHFAHETDIEFELEVSSMDTFSPSGYYEIVGVNLPICCLAEYDLPLPLVLRFVKQMSPRVVVTADRGCEMTGLPFASHVVHALQCFSSLLESVDAVGLDLKDVHGMERFLIGPGIEKIVRGYGPGRSGPWRDMFTSSGFSQVGLSDFAVSQAECIVRRAAVVGFQVEARWPPALVLCWRQKELAAVSVWKC